MKKIISSIAVCSLAICALASLPNGDSVSYIKLPPSSKNGMKTLEPSIRNMP